MNKRGYISVVLAWTVVVSGACSAEAPNVLSYDNVESTTTNGQQPTPATNPSSSSPSATGSPGGGNSSPSMNTSGSGGNAGGSPSTGNTAPQPAAGSGSCTSDASSIPIESSGRVNAECTDTGIQGVWYCYDDGVNTTSCQQNQPPFRDGAMCLSGETSVDPMYNAWGAGIGLTLNDPGGGTKRAFDAADAGIAGFSVTVTGDTGGLGLRIGYTGSTSESDVAPFVEVVGPGRHRVRFDEADISWEPNAPPVDPSRVFDVQVQVVGGDAAAEYDFCITELEPIYAAGAG